ncbi:OmpH family outer membrane protein [Pseudooceanicola sp.]|uniref:OmpH family outer membrane protein n=1 Tax=Pseudooceanicola sp. TaxID=1914328 RepID=UPI0035C70487
MTRTTWTSLAGAVGVTIALFAATPAATQSGFELGRSPDQVFSPVLTLDTDRLLNDSAAGREIERDLAEKSATLAAENRRIEAELTEEEKDLSVRRASLSTEDFRAAAAAFDEKVNRIREEQDAKLRELQGQSEQARLRILQAANPVLASIMRDTGAVAILEKSNVIVGLQSIDVTDTAIERLDAAMQDGGDIRPTEDTGATGDPATDAPAPTEGATAGSGD